MIESGVAASVWYPSGTAALLLETGKSNAQRMARPEVVRCPIAREVAQQTQTRVSAAKNRRVMLPARDEGVCKADSLALAFNA